MNQKETSFTQRSNAHKVTDQIPIAYSWVLEYYQTTPFCAGDKVLYNYPEN